MTHAIKVALWPSLITAVIGLAAAILINLAASSMRPVSVPITAMQLGQIESRTPYELAPWWLRTRAQPDCQSVMRAFQATRQPIDAAISPIVFGDRQGNARPCEILAGYLFQPDQERISKRSLHAGTSAAGSVSLLIGSVTGWRGLGYVELLVLIGFLGWCLLQVCKRRWNDARFLLLPASVAASGIILAAPGSFSLFPIVVVLLVLSSLPAIARLPKSESALVTWLPAVCGTSLFVLDPQAGSVVAGLSILLSVVVLSYRSEWKTTGAGMVGAFILAAVFSAILYVPAVLLSAKAGTTSIGEILRDLFLDRPVSGWISDIPASVSELYEWLCTGPIYYPFLAFLFFWSMPFVLLTAKWLKPDGSQPSRIERTTFALAPFAPVLGWIITHPGYLRRNPDAYVALVIAVSAFVLAVAANWALAKWQIHADGLEFDGNPSADPKSSGSAVGADVTAS